MPLTPHPIAVLDVETTGFSKTDRIIEIGIITFDADGNEEHRFESLIQPDRDIPNSFVHGITASMLAQAPHFHGVAARIASLIDGHVVVAHNAAFDSRMLNQEFSRLGHPLPPASSWTVDTMRLSKLLLPGSPTKLADALALSGVENKAAHNALADAVATSSLFYDLLDRGATVAADPLTVDAALLSYERDTSLPRPVHTGQAETDAYQQLLITALDDGVVTNSELELLVAKARDLGLSRDEASQIHESMLKRMALTAWADGILTTEEDTLIRSAAQSLGVDSAVMHELLASASQAPSVTLVPGGRICLTGELEVPRESWETRIQALGYTVGGITKNTCALVAADPNSRSGKAKKARDYDVPIISESELALLLGSATSEHDQDSSGSVYVDEPGENPEFADIFPWFTGATNDLAVVVSSWVNDFSNSSLANISPRLRGSTIPEGLNQERAAIKRWFNRHPEPLRATIADLRAIAGMGAKSISDAVHAVLLAAIDGIDSTDDTPENTTELAAPTTPPAPAPAKDPKPTDENRVFDWFALTKTDTSSLIPGAPNEIELALGRIQAKAEADRQRLANEVAQKITDICAKDERFADIVASRIITRSSTLDEIGQRWDVTRERIRQLEKQAGTQVSAVIELHVAALAHRVGRPMKYEAFLSENPDLATPIVGDGVLFDLLEGQSPIVHRRGEWVEPISASSELTEAATANANSYGVVPWASLSHCGPVDDADRAEWVASLLPDADLRGGHLFTRTRSANDRAAAVLSVTGKPMTVEEIIDFLGQGTQTSMSNALALDERVHRIRQGTWALVEWGGEEYTTVTDFIAARVDEHGSYPLDQLLEDVRELGIAETTVRTYCSNGEFVIDNGEVTRNTTEVNAEANPEEHAGMFFRDGAWQHLITVNYDHLRGSGFSVPRSLAGMFELSLLEKKSFTSPLGEQVLTFGRTNVATGSIRRFLQELGSKEGDRLWLRFADDGTFSVSPATDRRESTGIDELLNHSAMDDRGGDLGTLNEALGLAPDAPRRRTVSRFTHRREDRLVEIVRSL